MNAALEQIKTFWKELDLNQRVFLFVVFIGICAGMIALYIWSSRPRYTLLYGGLEPAEMSEVVSRIEEQGADYEIRGGSSIFVPREDVYSLRMELASEGLPKGQGIGFEIFDKGNFGISDFVQRTNYMRAIQGELARTITQLDGVRSARVMLVMPENRMIVEEGRGQSSASVFIETGGRQLDREAVNSIRFLIANSVDGIELDGVAVVDNMGNVLSESLRTDESLAEMSGQLKFRKETENYYAEKIQAMLGRVLGSENVVARVSADIRIDSETRTDIIYDPDSQVIRTRTVEEDVATTNESRDGQGAGVAANLEEGEGNGNETLSTSQDRRKNETTTYEINRSTTETILTPGEILKLSASVFIAMKYDQETGDQIPRTAEEINRFRGIVGRALGLTTQEELDALVSVEEMPFDKAPVMAQIQEPGLVDTIIQYEELIRQFVAVSLAVAIFAFFIRMVKRYRPDVQSLEPVDDFKAEAKNVTPRLTPEILNELIQTKPENVSTALRQWVEENKKN